MAAPLEPWPVLASREGRPPAREVKGHGIHYTPPELADFLAQRVVAQLDLTKPQLAILDPACGEGELLAAIARVVAERVEQLTLVGVDRDAFAIARARATLAGLGVEPQLIVGDFLDLAPDDQLLLPEPDRPLRPLQRAYDAIVSNPPYVRTQVLGAARARKLAERFQLSGRVDLYQVFVRAMTPTVRRGGILGLLCSNRFLTIQAGSALRDLLAREFELCEIFDLGDTKLFAAAVLPAIVIGRRALNGATSSCAFTRAYEYEGPKKPASQAASIIAALVEGLDGVVSVNGRDYEIEQGVLNRSAAKEPWRISNRRRERWLATVRDRTDGTFAEVGEIRVGIKTTADKVFIRSQWDDLPQAIQPESELLHPLITHHLAAPWHALNRPSKQKTVLYPYAASSPKRRPIELGSYPGARAYLESHRETLQSRRYVIDAGREWFEIWVPQQPNAWSKPKIVFPDISEKPRFLLDTTGAIVNGDCYWIALPSDVDPELTSLLLAVANSSFALAFYDAVCGNRLYAGRRRFITQYVRHFPLPALDSAYKRAIHELVQRVRALPECSADDRSRLEGQLNSLVWEGFGLHEEVRR
jgi:SAM-dependent methyltransferase